MGRKHTHTLTSISSRFCHLFPSSRSPSPLLSSPFLPRLPILSIATRGFAHRVARVRAARSVALLPRAPSERRLQTRSAVPDRAHGASLPATGGPHRGSYKTFVNPGKQRRRRAAATASLCNLSAPQQGAFFPAASDEGRSTFGEACFAIQRGKLVKDQRGSASRHRDTAGLAWRCVLNHFFYFIYFFFYPPRSPGTIC